MTPRRLESYVSPMALLESGIPLTLLIDLVWGPQSQALMDEEALREHPQAS